MVRAWSIITQLHAFAVPFCAAIDNGVGLTPAMGYNTWDDFRCGGINASNIRKVADAFVKYDLHKYGYEYIGIDDCWAVGRNKSSGVIIEDPVAFPDGMKAVVDYVHSKGLKFGIYTDRGTHTCEGRPGTQGFEQVDANTYASWGVDLVKEDSCYASTDHQEAFRQYALMRDALNSTGRPMYFALCGWSDWYAPPGHTLGNSWRYDGDVNGWGDAWNAISASSRLAQFAGPGGWNDPDALMGSSPGTAVHLSRTQSRTQFSLWAMMAAPLQIGSNIQNLSAFDLETYTNEEVIAVNQDRLGIQGKVIWDNCGGLNALGTLRRPPRRGGRQLSRGPPLRDNCFAVPACQQVWLRPLQDGYAVSFVNYTRSDAGVGAAPSGPSLRLEACDEAKEEQRWNVSSPGSAPSTVKSASGDKGCWEVNGCNYGNGSSVDTHFGCKPPPSPGVEDPCCSNMLFNISADGPTVSIVSTFSGHCFEMAPDGGGTLTSCSGAQEQRWELRGPVGRQQIASASGAGCIANAEARASAKLAEPPLSFDVARSLGWRGAMVRDLWAHEDLGIQTQVSVRLSGDGDSRLLKLTRPPTELLV